MVDALNPLESDGVTSMDDTEVDTGELEMNINHSIALDMNNDEWVIIQLVSDEEDAINLD